MPEPSEMAMSTTTDRLANGPLTVTLAISTMGVRVAGLRLPPPRVGLDFLILVQAAKFGADVVTAYRDRADVRIVILDTLGLSHSRNAAITQAGGDLVVFCDDDLELDLDGIEALRNAFEQDADLAMAAGWRRKQGQGRRRQRRSYGLTLFNSGRICAPELMLRRAAFLPQGVRFDPNFGLGAMHGLSEEYVFVTDALKAGLKGMSLPVITGTHAHVSTGDNWHDPALMRARQAMLARVFGRWAWVIRPLYAWRQRSRLGSWRAVLSFALNQSPIHRDNMAG